MRRFAARRRLSKEFDRLYKAGNEILQQYNPCKIKIESDRTVCTAVRRAPTRIRPNTLCCTRCFYWSSHGCTIQCLCCKLHFCTQVFDYLPPEAEIARTKMRSLRMSVSHLELLVPRKPKDYVIESVLDMYY